METARWASLLLGALLLQGTHGFIFGHHNHHSSHEHKDSGEENNAKKDPYRNPLNADYFCQGPCMDGWISYMGQCHRYVSDKRNWNEGERFCQTAFSRAHLTSIEDEEHSTFLMTLARSQDKNVGPFWTGASDTRGNILWGNLGGFLGIKKCKSLGLMGKEDPHLGLTWTGLGLLGDYNCNTRLPFVCMYKPKIFP